MYVCIGQGLGEIQAQGISMFNEYHGQIDKSLSQTDRRLTALMEVTEEACLNLFGPLSGSIH